MRREALPWHAWRIRAAVERGWLDRGGWLKSERRRLRIQMAMFGASIGLATAVLLFAFQRIADSFWPLLLLVAICASVPVYFSFAARRTMITRLKRIYLDAGICASCGYGLRDIPPEPDGCRVCPECGGAWRA